MNRDAQFEPQGITIEKDAGGDEASVAQALNQIERADLGKGVRWRIGTRIAFRFCFIYFGLFCVMTQILSSLVPLNNVNIPDLASLTPMRQIVFWTALHIFRVKTPLVYQGSGSGDKTFDWVLSFCLLVIAAVATAIWSVLDSKRNHYIALHKWFRVFMRFALAGQMLTYGLAKAIPLQMPFPFLTRLLEPYGRFSPMGVLWSSIGASPAYEVFAGCAEMLGGLLLFFPRTTLFGALVCLADMIQVFMLNMTYDVPVKLFAFHLILMSLFLLAPDARRLVDFFFLNRSVTPSTQPAILPSRRANRIALGVQVVFGVWLLSTNVYGSWKAWYTYGGGRPKPALYGIWDVDDFAQDGQLRSPLLTDNERWRRVIFDFTSSVAFQHADDTFTGYASKTDEAKSTIELTSATDKSFAANFAYQREDQDHLTLDGELRGHKVKMKLHRVDHTKFLLASRGFHWIQEYPFNR